MRRIEELCETLRDIARHPAKPQGEAACIKKKIAGNFTASDNRDCIELGKISDLVYLA